MRWRHWAALGASIPAGLTVGDDDQGAWLIYNSAFPLTQLGSPLHAEVKAELGEWVLTETSPDQLLCQRRLRGAEISQGSGK